MFVDGVSLQNWVSSSIPHQLWEVVDRSLLRRTDATIITEEDQEFNCLNQLLKVGLYCTKESLHERPSMMEIVLILQTIKNAFLEVVGTEDDVSTTTNSSSTTSRNASEMQSSSTS